MSAGSDDPLKRALTLSARMLSAGEKADWDDVSVLHGELEEALRGAGSPTQDNRESFEKLLQQQQHLRTLAESAQRELEEVMSRQNYNQRALHAYLSPGR